MTVRRRGALVVVLMIVLTTTSCARGETDGVSCSVTSWSPVSRAPAIRMDITFDENGLVREVVKMRNTIEEWHVADPQDVEYELLSRTQVAVAGELVTATTTDPDGTVTEVQTYEVRGSEILEPNGSDPEYTYVLGERPGEYRIVGRAGPISETTYVGSAEVEVRSLVNDIVGTYLLTGTDAETVYVFTLEYSGRSDTAIAQHDREQDMITAELPGIDIPSSFEWRYQVTNAAALLSIRYSDSALVLNKWIIGLPTSSRLLPLFCIGGLQ